MMPRCLGFVFVIAATASGAPAPRPEAPDFSKLSPEATAKWAGAEVLVVGKITKVVAGPVGLSSPPLRNYRLEVAVDRVLRGPAKLEKAIPANYSVRQNPEATFPEGECIVALKFVHRAWIVQAYEAATPAGIEQAKQAVSFPLGWTIQDGKLVSPWGHGGRVGPARGNACAVTGRPVLLAGPVRFTAEPVPPAKEFKFKNPDGDGEYKLTVTNDSDQEVEVPALLTDGKTVQWKESVVVRIQGKAYPFPGSSGSTAGLKPVVLKPGESVSGVVNALAFNGPMWPRGGYRIEFQFCLGELSATHSFYYFSAHHDPLRKAAIPPLKK